MIRLGIYPHEAEPQRVIVSVRMTIDYPEPLDEDAIERVLDYDFRPQRHPGASPTYAVFALQETLCEANRGRLCLADGRVRTVQYVR